jgi:hypothetical protein
MRIFIFLIISLAGLSSCKLFKKKDNGNKDIIARVYDKYLYKDDIEEIAKSSALKHDSASVIKAFVDNWIHQQVVIHKAESNLNAEKKDVEKQLEEYRNSLIRYAYERELIQQKLDTNVTDKEIESFYDANPDNFQLKNNILRVIFLKLNKKSPKLGKVRDLYKSENPKDKAWLEDYCRQYALNYYLDDKTWLQFDDLLKEIPIKTYDQEEYLQNNRNIEVEDSTNIYFISIKGFKIKNTLSPLSFEKNNIRTMMINQKKLKLIEDMEKQAYEEAKNKSEIEVRSIK